MLRPFRPDDAPSITRLAGDRAIADTTLTVPHPYPPGAAEAWIAHHAPGWSLGREAVFAITDPTGGLVGAIGLVVTPEHRRGELGYWVGRPFWNRGYATSAARAVMAFGFAELGLHRIQAMHLVRNPASGRVLVKAGMEYEGTLRHYLVKWDTPEDVAVYGIVRPGAG
jgi:RimJ/RimL family protein N-acetyltransferase